MNLTTSHMAELTFLMFLAFMLGTILPVPLPSNHTPPHTSSTTQPLRAECALPTTSTAELRR